MNELELTLEQQANIRIFQLNCQHLSREQAIEMLHDVYRQMLIKESFYKQMLFKDLGIVPPTLGGQK